MTGVRFLLALWVVCHHLVSPGMMLESWAHSLPSGVAMFLQQGHVAVRTFFVLSGFVLARGYGNSGWKRRDLISYAIARVARVYPVYLVSLAVVAYFIFEFLRSSANSAGAKFAAVAEYGLILQGWMPASGHGWNTPAWSLSCEFVFYLCLPVILIWLGKRSRWKLAALAVTAIALPVVLRHSGFPQAWKPVLHLGDFLVGIVTARLYSMLKLRGANTKGQWIYLAAIAGTIVAVVFPPAGLDLGSILRPLNAMLVLGLAMGGGPLARFLSTSGAQFLGQASYSLYILHVPVLWWCGTRAPWFAIVYLVGMVAISAVCFEWIEKPANRRIRKWSRKLT